MEKNNGGPGYKLCKWVMREIMKENYEKAFGLFCSTDEIRPMLHEPFKQKGIYCATDGHGLIYMPVDVLSWDLKEDEEAPDVRRVLPTEFHEPIPINIQKLKSEMEKYSLKVKEYKTPPKECYTCEGEGELECNLGHDHDCEECDGTGETEGRNPTGNRIPDTSTIFKIWNTHLSYTLLKRLVDSANLLGVDTIYKVCGGEKENKFAFNVGETKILLMAFLSDGDNELGAELPVDRFV